MSKKYDLKKQLSEEENDLKAMGIRNQLVREDRSERFEDKWLPKLQKKCNVHHNVLTGAYTFEIKGYGVMDFYPKANNLLIRKLNKWKKPALRWMIVEFNLENA